MFEVSILGTKYIRLLPGKLDIKKIEELKKKYNYIFVVSPIKVDIPGFSCQKRLRSIIDMKRPLQEIYASFKNNTRNEINQAKKCSEFKFIVADKKISEVYKFYKRFELRRGWYPILKRELEKCLLFTTYYRGTLIAGVACYCDQDMMRVAKIFSARLENVNQEQKKMAGWSTRNLILEICKYCQDHGIDKLDLGGVNLDDSSKAGIAQFKISFGGRLENSYVYRYTDRYFVLIRRFLRILKKDLN